MYMHTGTNPLFVNEEIHFTEKVEDLKRQHYSEAAIVLIVPVLSPKM